MTGDFLASLMPMKPYIDCLLVVVAIHVFIGI